MEKSGEEPASGGPGSGIEVGQDGEDHEEIVPQQEVHMQAHPQETEEEATIGSIEPVPKEEEKAIHTPQDFETSTDSIEPVPQQEEKSIYIQGETLHYFKGSRMEGEMSGSAGPVQGVA